MWMRQIIIFAQIAYQRLKKLKTKTKNYETI